MLDYHGAGVQFVAHNEHCSPKDSPNPVAEPSHGEAGASPFPHRTSLGGWDRVALRRLQQRGEILIQPPPCSPLHAYQGESQAQAGDRLSCDG